MKTFIYTYERKKSDRSGNPRHYARVYRVKNNVPEVIIDKIDINYRDSLQAVIDELEQRKFIPKCPRYVNRGRDKRHIKKYPSAIEYEGIKFTVAIYQI